MGANVTANGATFKVWAPRAQKIYLILNTNVNGCQLDVSNELTKDNQGCFSGFVEGAKDGDLYRYYVVGNGSRGLKRDPYTRELQRENWNPVQYIENHDLVWIPHHNHRPQIIDLADGSNHSSWYAKSRARVANGLLLTGPGIPMLFMGEEMGEYSAWSDDPGQHSLGWDELASQKDRMDFERFTRELIALRRNQPALRSETLHVSHIHNDNRVIVVHRWVENVGQDVVIVASFNEETFQSFPPSSKHSLKQFVER